VKGWIPKTIVSVLLFGVCLWVLHGQIRDNWDSIWLLKDEFSSMGFPVFLSTAFFALGVSVRAHRWGLCLGRPDLFALSFRSIAIGYLVQCPLSKVGEVVRMTNQKQHSNLSLGQIVSTVTIDRLLDVFCLLIVLLLSMFLGGGIIQEHFPHFQTLLPKVGFMFVGLTLALISIFFFHQQLGRLIASLPFLPDSIKSRLQSFLEHFRLGLKNCQTFAMILYLLFSTLLIWLSYFSIFYLLVSPWSVMPNLSATESLFLFVISSLGSLIPIPGGLALPLFLQQGILLIHPEVGEGLALSISLFAYFVNFWFINIVLGGISWMWQVFQKQPLAGDAHGHV